MLGASSSPRGCTRAGHQQGFAVAGRGRRRLVPCKQYVGGPTAHDHLAPPLSPDHVCRASLRTTFTNHGQALGWCSAVQARARAARYTVGNTSPAVVVLMPVPLVAAGLIAVPFSNASTLTPTQDLFWFLVCYAVTQHSIACRSVKRLWISLCRR